MSAGGSSAAFTEPSKGERRRFSRAGGEQRMHGEEEAREGWVCTRSSGGRRGAGDVSAFGDALMLSNQLERAQKATIPFPMT